MIPKKIAIEKYYWSCGNKAHRHRTEETAYSCIRAASSPKLEQRRWTDVTFAECQAMRDSGMTLAKIGEHYHLSRGRIREVLLEWKRRKARLEFFAANPSASEREFWDWYWGT